MTNSNFYTVDLSLLRNVSPNILADNVDNITADYLIETIIDSISDFAVRGYIGDVYDIITTANVNSIYQIVDDLSMKLFGDDLQFYTLISIFDIDDSGTINDLIDGYRNSNL